MAFLVLLEKRAFNYNLDGLYAEKRWVSENEFEERDISQLWPECLELYLTHQSLDHISVFQWFGKKFPFDQEKGVFDVLLSKSLRIDWRSSYNYAIPHA